MCELIVHFVVCFVVFILPVLLTIYLAISSNKEKIDEPKSDEQLEEAYIKPEFKPLTEEQIKVIHSKGKITPAEKVEEWESMDLCAPGDAIGSVAFRCRKFGCCHDCLVDYASNTDEYTSLFDDIKIVNDEYPPVFVSTKIDNSSKH